MLTKQAKAINREQIERAAEWILNHKRNGLRNQTIFYLSVYAGLRAKEIACLTWDMVTDAEGNLASEMRLTNAASKGSTGGRVLPINETLKANLVKLMRSQDGGSPNLLRGPVILNERGKACRPHYVVQMFAHWYEQIGFVGCSSHSGRRTFITAAARNIAACGGSLRDVQYLAGHATLHQTQEYIVVNDDAVRAVVELI